MLGRREKEITGVSYCIENNEKRINVERCGVERVKRRGSELRMSIGVRGTSSSCIGVRRTSSSCIGVRRTSNSCIGVRRTSNSCIGVRRTSNSCMGRLTCTICISCTEKFNCQQRPHNIEMQY